jgi:formate dehydrogenase major subunit
MSRWLSWLSELQPELFCEISPELALIKELKNGDWATITTERGEIETRVLVTQRLPSLRIQGRMVHQIGLPYHWGSKRLVRGDVANELIPFVADPNVSIQESKALTGDIRPGRHSGERRVVTSGELVKQEENGTERDLPEVKNRRIQSHGIRSSQETTE